MLQQEKILVGKDIILADNNNGESFADESYDNMTLE